MKCPLLTMGYNASLLNETAPGVDCLKEECAWWSDHSQICSVKMAQVNLGSIADSLDAILQSIPLKVQLMR